MARDGSSRPEADMQSTHKKSQLSYINLQIFHIDHKLPIKKLIPCATFITPSVLIK